MISEFVSNVYVGCATDGRFVVPTCTMLSSLDDNARLPEATVIVADFGLTEVERGMIRESAGSLGPNLHFLTLDRASPQIVAAPSFDFPFPLIGRLVIPREIRDSGARLILLDSDMIVNKSLRPLFEMSMQGCALGAVYDPITVREHYGRERNDNYFNAGMMLIDLDLFNADDIGAEAMRRLASYDPPPKWLDQDALNEVLAGRWLTLDRRWNYFHAADRRQFDADDYREANIIHFAGPKPWEGHPHPAAPLYFHHARRMEEKVLHRAEQFPGGSNRVFMATCYEVLLGRQRESDAALTARAHLSHSRFAASVIESPEFEANVLRPLAEGSALPFDRFGGVPTIVQKFWAADRLPILKATVARIERAPTWRDFLTAIVSDRYLMGMAGRVPLTVDSTGSIQAEAAA